MGAPAAAFAASAGLDDGRAGVYLDLILTFLSESAREAFVSMQPFKYEYQSDFARKYFAQGREEGKAEGTVEGHLALLLKLMARRFGPLPRPVEERLRAADSSALEAVAERMLQARTLEEALG